MYSTTCLKRPLQKTRSKELQNAQESILQYFRPALNKLPFLFKAFVLSIFEWPLKTGFTVPII